jgi:hypothetical protein
VHGSGNWQKYQFLAGVISVIKEGIAGNVILEQL